jgi:hypothetical protein
MKRKSRRRSTQETRFVPQLPLSATMSNAGLLPRAFETRIEQLAILRGGPDSHTA